MSRGVKDLQHSVTPGCAGQVEVGGAEDQGSFGSCCKWGSDQGRGGGGWGGGGILELRPKGRRQMEMKDLKKEWHW